MMTPLPVQGTPEWLEMEKYIQRRLREEFKKLVLSYRIKPDALLVHPSATQQDIDEIVAYYRGDDL